MKYDISLFHILPENFIAISLFAHGLFHFFPGDILLLFHCLPKAYFISFLGIFHYCFIACLRFISFLSWIFHCYFIACLKSISFLFYCFYLFGFWWDQITTCDSFIALICMLNTHLIYIMASNSNKCNQYKPGAASARPGKIANIVKLSII